MGSHHVHSSERLLTTALGITLAYMVVEALGGLLTGSLALLADAGHMLSDAGALGIAVAAARLARRPPDQRRTMGHQRAEVLGAALNAGALGVLAVWIAAEAVGRAADPHPILAGPMIAVASIGLAVNLGIAWMLHGGGDDLNRRAAMWHVLGDALGSVGAIAAGVLVATLGWLWADPAISVVIAGILLVGAARVLREVYGVLMHSAPATIDVAALEAHIVGVDGVESVHDLHVWTLRPGEDVVTTHVVLCGEDPADAVCAAVCEALRAELPHAHITVQPEHRAKRCTPRPAAPARAHEHHAH